MKNSHTTAQRDPWEPYDNPGKGKGKGHPITPEPAGYGAFFIAIVLIIVFVARRYARKRY